MYKLFLFTLITTSITVVSGKIILPNFDITYPSGQLTPKGYYHPLFEPVTGMLMFESKDIPKEAYKGTILLAVASGAGFHDDIIFRHMSYGCAGTILMGGAPLFPGDSVAKMRNAESFAWMEDGKEVIYPAVGITVSNFTNLFGILNETFFVNKTPVIVTITSEENDNEWKLRGLYPPFQAMVIINGTASLFYVVWCCKTLQLLVKGKLFHKGAVTSSTTIINLTHNVTRIIGLVNFNCVHQMFDFVSAGIISSFNVPLLFIACWIHALVMYQIVDKNSLEVKSFLGKKVIWPFIVACVLLLVNDNLLAGLSGVSYKDPYSPLYIAIVRVAVTCILAFILGVVYTIGSALILKALKSRPVDSSHNDRLIRRHIIMLLIMSACLFGYCLSAGLTFNWIHNPYDTMHSWFYYNLDLSIMSGCLCYSNYYATRGRLYANSNSGNSNSTDGKSTDGKSNNSEKMTKTTDTSSISPRASTLM